MKFIVTWVGLVKSRVRKKSKWGIRCSYKRRRSLQFEVGHKVFLKISPVKGVMRFCQKGNLSSRYIGPYEILEKVGMVAMSRLHDVFHLSMLRKYVADSAHILKYP